MTSSRFFLLGLFLLAAGNIVSAMDEGESIASTSQRNLGSRIVGGTKAIPTRYPYFTYLNVTFDTLSTPYSTSCGGTLIANDVVLTSADCLTPFGWNESVASIDTYVNATTRPVGRYAYYRPAKAFTIHSSFDWQTFANDIALIYLENPVTGVTLAQINKVAATPAVGKAVNAIGLGHIRNPPVVRATNLMQVSMNTLQASVCTKVYGSKDFKTANQICSGTTKNICYGDGGGPLLLTGTTASKDVQVGITSYFKGSTCGGTASVFTRVSKYVTWINSNVCADSKYPPSTCP